MGRGGDSGFIKKRVEVEESDRTRTWGREASGPPAGSGSGSLFLVGPPGSGRTDLGRALAERLGLPLAAVDRVEDLPGADGPVVGVVAPEVFRRSAETLKDRGPVAYLMATPGLLAERLGLNGEDERRALAVESARDEPLYLSHAHFVLPADRDPEENLEDLAEKLALTGFGSGGGSRWSGNEG